ncbi:hypothetical protein A3D83_01925 [Candidatus Daviesbacteria bacterium RIFCSPHIGHO2_02_FULL_41_10]|uniref:Uncharacterized protein n=2 Tax=Candidatus Daviesiibacteriota TaxID=1752718 RepID=A0A1F5ISP5_9BACT|nr:MAG: hypothetical protein A2871_00625 [Candidatus Daviesbacteria bacterium RIFCSPHIGHO2_01_FULL_41_23]OGE32898.1 MAG: hypothetical protein A3D83_01925 [Candidatus Daviesbacteria bacterium RIFCSPHIGHO2_02_FULL_41_10]OGE62399.1 MAG: hypothetical protein A2967_01115 [Candidatus Daviesbacteria bacterium RIFCSPLOWO2_01_FULL_41_32]
MAHPDQSLGIGGTQYYSYDSQKPSPETGGGVTFSEIDQIDQVKRTSGTRARWLPRTIGLALVSILIVTVLLAAKDADTAKAGGPPIPQRNSADWVIRGGDPINVAPDWPGLHPQNILAAADAKDQSGNITGQMVAINNTTRELVVGNSNLYVNSCNTSNGECYAYQWAMELPMQNPRVILLLSPVRAIIGGEETLRSSKTKLVDCSIPAGSCSTINYNFGYSGPVTDLALIENNNGNIYIYGNNANSHDVGQFILKIPETTIPAAYRIQAVTDVNNVVQITNLPATGSPRITETNTNNKTIRVVSSGLNSMRPGIDVANVNYADASGSMNNYLAGEVGGVNGMVEYSKDQWLVSNNNSQFIAGVSITSAGIPVMDGYKIDHANWMDNQGIPGIIPGRFRVTGLGTWVDGSGRLHVLPLGYYPTTSTQSLDSPNHLIVADFIKGTDPNVDISALTWRSLTPDKVDTMGSAQKEIRSRKVNGQLKFEFPLHSSSFTYDGMVSVSAGNLTVEYPDAGLDQKPIPPTPLPIRPKAFLPILTVRYASAW